MDTACSSALVAMHIGLKHVRSENSPALASAVNLMLAETTTAAAFAAGMLTQNGRCKTLDSSADGYVRSNSFALHALYFRPIPNKSLILQLFQQTLQ